MKVFVLGGGDGLVDLVGMVAAEEILFLLEV